MTLKASCHCGQVAFEVDAALPDSVMACNCSICVRKGALMWFVGRDRLTLLTPESQLGSYEFNKHRIRHRFCPTCGIHAYGEGTDPSGQRMAAINVRCLEDVDLAALQVQHYDGRAA